MKEEVITPRISVPTGVVVFAVLFLAVAIPLFLSFNITGLTILYMPIVSSSVIGAGFFVAILLVLFILIRRKRTIVWK